MNETPADRLRRARINGGYDSASAAAQAFGWNVNTYVSNENGNAPFSFNKARTYAGAFGVSAEWLYTGAGEPVGVSPMPGMRPISRAVPVIGVVQAGLWQEVIEDEPQPEELLPINLQGFDGSQLYALRVSGPSMDLFYPEGTRVVVCPAAEIGVREGDHVVVRRRRGDLVETTLKEIVQAKQGIELWPRSSDPRFQEPIRLQTVRDADEGPEIIGVVVAHYGVRPQQTRPLIQL
jgi:SOS-response transcriptional repressor LexA